MTYICFIIGLVLLALGGDTLVKGAVTLANKMNISPLLIGIVLVGFGTSTPELMASILAVFQNPPAPGIAVGNVIGSNIANILLVLGLTAAISTVFIDKKAFARDSFFLILSTAALCVAVQVGTINFLAGVILDSLLLVYVFYSYYSERKNRKKTQPAEEDTIKGSALKAFLITVLGIGMTMFGAKLLVDNAIIIARNFGISESVIGLTLVAVGTSLPELATSVMASIRKQNELAFGNVVGSNIYNALFILGTVALLTPIHVPNDLDISLIIMVCATALLVLCGAIYKKIVPLMGVLFLILYAGYIVCLK